MMDWTPTNAQILTTSTPATFKSSLKRTYAQYTEDMATPTMIPGAWPESPERTVRPRIDDGGFKTSISQWRIVRAIRWGYQTLFGNRRTDAPIKAAITKPAPIKAAPQTQNQTQQTTPVSNAENNVDYKSESLPQPPRPNLQFASRRLKSRLGIPTTPLTPAGPASTPSLPSRLATPPPPNPTFISNGWQSASKVKLGSPFPLLRPALDHAQPTKLIVDENAPETPAQSSTAGQKPSGLLTPSISRTPSLEELAQPSSDQLPTGLLTPSASRRPSLEEACKSSPSDQLHSDLLTHSRTPSLETPKRRTPSPPGSAEHSAKSEKRFFTRTARKEQEAAEKGYQIIPLTEEWNKKVDQALKRGHGTYTPHDLIKVVPAPGGGGGSSWLNDETINGYLKIITDHGNKGQKKGASPRYHAFNSFFMSNLLKKGYESVKRWSKRANIEGNKLKNLEKVFVPVNSNSHWTLLVVSPKAKRIEYYDSLGYSGCSTQYVNAAKQWLQGELGQEWNEEEWVVEEAATSQQDNGSDCGVFAVTNAKMVMLGRAPTTYGPRDIPLQRRRIVAELIAGCLL